MNKSSLKQIGEVTTLIGAILETIFHALLIFPTFGIWIIFAAIFIPLTWVTRKNAVVYETKGWMIYGIVQSFFFNWIGLVGYILLLIDKINLDNEQEQKQ